MSSQPWLYFDDTASEIEYSPSQDWSSTTHARAETGLAVFNDTLTATASAQANIHIEFTASQITIIGATLALPGATEDGAPLSSYVLDGSKNTAFVFRGDVKNDTSVVFFVSETLPEQRHSLDITVLSASGKSPFLFDRIALLGPQNVPATSTVVWVTTAFPTPSAASQNTTIINVTQDHSLPVGAIVGGVVGGVALIVAALLAFYFLFWRNRRYGSRGFESEAFNADAEKYRLTSRNSGVPPDVQAAQMEPFLAPQYPQQYPAQYPAQYADYPHPASAPSIDPRASMYSAPALSPPITATTTAVGAPQFYPPPSSVVSSSAYSAGSGRTLTLANDAAIAAAAAGGFAALTSAEKKEAEAKAESSPGESSKPVQFHRDSGVRFDNEGRPVQPEDDDATKGSGSGSGVKHDPQPLVDVPPEYSEL
ncbi:hypothetical protein C8Q74DRAFT_1364770 [Fomes fomentarius]|nr:hypothetical protein C8Q74DRAFT_1364770 [Fomes fomentarius]